MLPQSVSLSRRRQVSACPDTTPDPSSIMRRLLSKRLKFSVNTRNTRLGLIERGLANRSFEKDAAGASSRMPITAKVHLRRPIFGVEERENQVRFGEAGLRNTFLA